MLLGSVLLGRIDYAVRIELSDDFSSAGNGIQTAQAQKGIVQ